MKNYYNVLGIPANASLQTINEAYKKLAQKFHPDRNPGDEFFASWFKEINEARQVLANEEERAEYDYKLANYADAYELLRQQHLNQVATRSPRYHKHSASYSRRKKAWMGAGFGVILVGTLLFFNTMNSSVLHENDVPFVLSSEPQNAVAKVSLPKAKEEESPVAEVQKVEPIAVPEEQEIAEEKASINQVEQEKPAHSKSTPNVSTRPLNDTEVATIISLLQAEPGANCVQIIQSADSEINDDFAIAHILQENGYTIAGREISKSVSTGLSVEQNGNCLRLYIGRSVN
ncbi:J domain-containing protein [Aridibaculum aurantiacum]|uniref:J domain-containing protein n=1 Tax=Aridibaculum aurantiacum TaxID=2810307 RepID=UPI001A973568|nr:J domain-containing protein [Aridibaculum aurantiacum]